MGTITPRTIPVVDTWVPADLNLLAMAFDPGGDMVGGFGSATGVVYLIRVPIRTAKLVTNVVLFMQTQGTTLTAGQSFAGIFAELNGSGFTAGQRIGVSADQSASWANAGNANQYLTIPMTGGPFFLTPDIGGVWVSAVSNGTTPPTWGRGPNFNAAAANGLLTPATARFATNGTGTSLPASITPSANVFIQQALWAGLS